VDQADERSPRRVDARVPRRGRSGAARRDDPGGAVGGLQGLRRIVDDDDLVLERRILCREGVEARAEPVGAVPGRDDDAGLPYSRTRSGSTTATGTPPASSERCTASIVRTTSSPSAGEDRGSGPPRTARRNSAISSASGSAGSILSDSTSPVR